MQSFFWRVSQPEESRGGGGGGGGGERRRWIQILARFEDLADAKAR